jgi:hypothetical protein
MDFRPIVTALETLDNSPRLARMTWAVIGVAAMFGLAALVQSIRWW